MMNMKARAQVMPSARGRCYPFLFLTCLRSLQTSSHCWSMWLFLLSLQVVCQSDADAHWTIVVPAVCAMLSCIGHKPPLDRLWRTHWKRLRAV